MAEKATKSIRWQGSFINIPPLGATYETVDVKPHPVTIDEIMASKGVIFPDGSTTEVGALEAGALRCTSECASANLDVLQTSFVGPAGKGEETWRLARLLVDVTNLPEGTNVDVRLEGVTMLTMPARPCRPRLTDLLRKLLGYRSKE